MGGQRREAWWVRVVVGVWVLGLAGVAASEERFRAGSTELTIAGGLSVSHNTGNFENLETVEGFHLLPHFGYFVTDEQGPGWLRGNLELLAEPNLIHLDASDSATLGGLAVLGRWLFATGDVVRPYFEVGLGVLGGQMNLRQSNCDVNFIIEGGPGALVFVSERTALTAGYRLHHISNAGACSKNLGLNSSLFMLGVSYFFP